MTKLQAWVVCCKDGSIHSDRYGAAVTSREAPEASYVREAYDLIYAYDDEDMRRVNAACGPHTVVELGAVEELRALLASAVGFVKATEALAARINDALESDGVLSDAPYHERRALFEAVQEHFDHAGWRALADAGLLAPPVEKEPDSE